MGLIAYYQEAVKTSGQRFRPLTCYYHQDPRPDKFGGTAHTGGQPYLGNSIPELSGSVVFILILRANKKIKLLLKGF